MTQLQPHSGCRRGDKRKYTRRRDAGGAAAPCAVCRADCFASTASNVIVITPTGAGWWQFSSPDPPLTQPHTRSDFLPLRQSIPCLWWHRTKICKNAWNPNRLTNYRSSFLPPPSLAPWFGWVTGPHSPQLWQSENSDCLSSQWQNCPTMATIGKVLNEVIIWSHIYVHVHI